MQIQEAQLTKYPIFHSIFQEISYQSTSTWLLPEARSDGTLQTPGEGLAQVQLSSTHLKGESNFHIQNDS